MNYCPKCGAEEVKDKGEESWRFKCHSFFYTDGRRETLTTYKDGYYFSQTLNCANKCIADLQDRLGKVEKYIEEKNMKFKVTYYDYDSDKVLEKDCFSFNYETKDNSFSFTPIDNPVTVDNFIIISRPILSISYCQDGRLNIVVDGYQRMRNRGYWQSKTTITSYYE